MILGMGAGTGENFYGESLIDGIRLMSTKFGDLGRTRTLRIGVRLATW